MNLNKRAEALKAAEKAGGVLIGEQPKGPVGPMAVNRRVVLREIGKMVAGVLAGGAFVAATPNQAQAYNGHWSWSDYRRSHVSRWWETSAFEHYDWRWNYVVESRTPARFTYSTGHYPLSFYWYERLERTFVRWDDPYAGYAFYVPRQYRY